MTKKLIYFVIISSLIFGSIGSWLFIRFVIPRVNAIPLFSRYNLTPNSAPLIINRREEIHINEGSDTVAAVQTAQPWVVGIISGSDPSHAQVSAAGMVLSSDGIIALTKSAVPASGTVNLAFSDGRVLQAKVQAADPGSEIVLAAVQTSDLAVSNLGFSRDLLLGQRMIVLQPSLSASHPSAQVSYLSSDIKNSAGALLSSDQSAQTFKIDGLAPNFEGAVALSTDGKIQGIFSKGQIITADTIRSAWESYAKSGTIKRNYFGFYYQTISKTLANQINLTSSLKLSEGILVHRPSSGASAVIAASPASIAGLQEGDLITRANGSAINLENSFEDLAARLNPGDDLNLQVSRNSQILNLKLVTGSR